ncbi:phospholipase D-like domain-containing protein [Streptomyces sp. NPDC017413]|uniref:phospholipase D-like domain-containing protein n=1 Tax=Streptomyces sp. NPDC017413 TaxID=3364994 RepID=UPI0037ADC22C
MPTFSPDSLLAARFQNARPGLELTAIADAALPVARIGADVLAQDRKQIPLLDEFVLRLVGTNLRTEEAIGGFLGLPSDMVIDTIADHFHKDLLTYGPSDSTSGARRLRLTPRGEQQERELSSITPVRVNEPLIFDQLLWKVSSFDRRMIIPRRQAQEQNMLLLPVAQRRPIEISDLTTAAINIQLRERGLTDREVLQVKQITESKAPRVLPAKLLVYADADRTDIQLGVVIDGELSPDHELALLSHGGAKALGIQVEAPADRPSLDPDLERARIPLAEVTKRRAEQAAVQLATSAPEESAEGLPRDEIRAISVFEHSDLLEDALTQARRRILLIAPWIKRAIVDTSFISKLETRLRRGVSVHIAYGYSPNDPKNDRDAVRRIENLASRYKEKFTFTRVKSTHAKILIYDDVWITTSFNWLSFAGDRDRTYRMEEGTLVRGRRTVDENYQHYLDLIAQESE